MTTEKNIQLLSNCNTKQEYVNAYMEIVGQDLVSEAGRLGYFDGPASTQHHGVLTGGLVKHSIQVLHNCLLLTEAFDGPQIAHRQDEKGIEQWEKDLVVACLFHDLCKAGMYEETTRNVQTNGVWHKVPYFKVIDDNTGFGHGAESLYRLERAGWTFNYKAWAMAVYWHMGNYGLDYAESLQYRNACRRYPEVLMLHTADMMAATIQGL
jgi:hypothetical protein